MLVVNMVPLQVSAPEYDDCRTCATYATLLHIVWRVPALSQLFPSIVLKMVGSRGICYYFCSGQPCTHRTQKFYPRNDSTVKFYRRGPRSYICFFESEGRTSFRKCEDETSVWTV
jgi:hypothetical protein